MPQISEEKYYQRYISETEKLRAETEKLRADYSEESKRNAFHQKDLEKDYANSLLHNMKLSRTLHLRAALEMVVTLYTRGHPELQGEGNQRVLDVIAKYRDKL